MRRMIRGIVDSVVEGAIKRIAASGLIGESFADREYFQHYGLTSRPLQGAEAIFIREGNQIIAIASDDRRYRLAIEDGEVALYDYQGQAIHLKSGKTVHIYGTDHLKADVGQDTTITCPLVKAVAETKVLLQTPLVECTTDLQVDQNLVVAGNGSFGGGLTMTGENGSGDMSTPGSVSAQGDVSDGKRSMAGDRQIYDGHDHPGDSGGTTQAPNQKMG